MVKMAEAMITALSEEKPDALRMSDMGRMY
jgi:hypothetical protein